MLCFKPLDRHADAKRNCANAYGFWNARSVVKCASPLALLGLPYPNQKPNLTLMRNSGNARNGSQTKFLRSRQPRKQKASASHFTTRLRCGQRCKSAEAV